MAFYHNDNNNSVAAEDAAATFTSKAQADTNHFKDTHRLTALDQPQISTQEPAFHQFLDLPAELRYQVYKEYFHEEEKAAASLFWRNSYCRPEVTTRKGEDKRSFLPDICFVSQSLRSESLSVLMTYLTLEIKSHDDGDRMRKLATAPTHGLRVIRKLRFTDFNGAAESKIRPEHEQLAVYMAGASTALKSSLILQLSSCFGKIEELTLNFYAPTMTHRSTRTTYATPINKFIERFGIPESLLLRNIRKIVITGQSCMKSDYEHERSVQDDRVEHLQALREPAQRIKDAFSSEGRDVDVRLWLLYSGKYDETVLKSSRTMGALQ
jgi:hypothetical protein